MASLYDLRALGSVVKAAGFKFANKIEFGCKLPYETLLTSASEPAFILTAPQTSLWAA